MPKQRVSLTLEQSLVERLDTEADMEELNRSQMVEKVLKEYFESQGVDTAVVLCGDPDLKSLQLYKGRSILSTILENFSDQGVSRGVLLTGKNRERIHEEFGSSYEGMRLDYLEDESVAGTASALKDLEAELNSPFLVVNGHVIAEVDIDEMYRFHRSNETLATMALTTVEEPSKYGVAKLKGQKVIGFEEKPEPGQEPSRLINAGTYIMEPSIFKHLEAESLEKVFEQLASEDELSGYIYGGEWTDVS